MLSVSSAARILQGEWNVKLMCELLSVSIEPHKRGVLREKKSDFSLSQMYVLHVFTLRFFMSVSFSKIM